MTGIYTKVTTVALHEKKIIYLNETSQAMQCGCQHRGTTILPNVTWKDAVAHQLHTSAHSCRYFAHCIQCLPWLQQKMIFQNLMINNKIVIQ